MGTPFPVMPMVAIAIGLTSHSYALTSLFPYVGYMVQYLGATDDKDQAGYYAGYVASALMVGRFGSSYFWGRFADRYGRLPVMYISLCSMATLPIAFGVAPTFYWAITLRFLLGATNGLVATAKTMISEVCSKEHEVVGMSTITACWSIGLVMGPGVGGLLAEPATHHPRYFSESGLFGRYPYLLPNLVGACIALIGLPMVYFFLTETRHGGSHGIEFAPLPISGASASATHLENEEAEQSIELAPLTNAGSHGDVDLDHEESETARCLPSASSSHKTQRVEPFAPPAVSGDVETGNEGQTEQRCVRGQVKDSNLLDGEEVEEARSACIRECLVPIKLLAQRRVRRILLVYGLVSFVKIGADEVYPLWALSTMANGGLDWTTEDIGRCLSIVGGAMLLTQMVVYPRLIKRIGVQRSQRWSASLTVPLFFLFPALSRLQGRGSLLLAATLGLLFMMNICSSTMFINVALATNNAVDPSERATLNGISMTLGSLAKAAGPSSFSLLFAWSINGPRPPPLDFHFVFLIMAVSMVAVTFVSWNVISVPSSLPNELRHDHHLRNSPTARAKAVHGQPVDSPEQEASIALVHSPATHRSHGKLHAGTCALSPRS